MVVVVAVGAVDVIAGVVVVDVIVVAVVAVVAAAVGKLITTRVVIVLEVARDTPYPRIRRGIQRSGPAG